MSLVTCVVRGVRCTAEVAEDEVLCLVFAADGTPSIRAEKVPSMAPRYHVLHECNKEGCRVCARKLRVCVVCLKAEDALVAECSGSFDEEEDETSGLYSVATAAHDAALLAEAARFIDMLVEGEPCNLFEDGAIGASRVRLARSFASLAEGLRDKLRKACSNRSGPEASEAAYEKMDP